MSAMVVAWLALAPQAQIRGMLLIDSNLTNLTAYACSMYRQSAISSHFSQIRIGDSRELGAFFWAQCLSNAGVRDGYFQAEVVVPEFLPPAFILMNQQSPRNVQARSITCRVCCRAKHECRAFGVSPIPRLPDPSSVDVYPEPHRGGSVRYHQHTISCSGPVVGDMPEGGWKTAEMMQSCTAASHEAADN